MRVCDAHRIILFFPIGVDAREGEGFARGRVEIHARELGDELDGFGDGGGIVWPLRDWRLRDGEGFGNAARHRMQTRGQRAVATVDAELFAARMRLARPRRGVVDVALARCAEIARVLQKAIERDFLEALGRGAIRDPVTRALSKRAEGIDVDDIEHSSSSPVWDGSYLQTHSSDRRAPMRPRAEPPSPGLPISALPQLRLPPAERQPFIYVSVAIRAIERKLNVRACGPTSTIIAQCVQSLQFAVETTRDAGPHATPR